MTLRCGFTTGTAAAAATQAALIVLLDGRAPELARVLLPGGEWLAIQVHACRQVDARTAEASVIKDAGDDPDITHGAEIGARVSWFPGGRLRAVTITGGTGVGLVTRPGLEIPPGQPAINAGPRFMITRAAMTCLNDRGLYGIVSSEICVPRGLELARHTLNARLGIVGGISILGTTGIVRPLSHEAYVATIAAAMSVARASGLQEVVLTTGRRSERMAQAHLCCQPVEAFVQIGDYFAESIALAAQKGFGRVTLALFFGKALKMAQGAGNTHARSAELSLGGLARWTHEAGGDAALARAVAASNTAREAFNLIREGAPAVIHRVGSEMIRTTMAFSRHQLAVRGLIFGFDGKVRFDG